jgi:GMP synthase (glutamine-hydrolysing)
MGRFPFQGTSQITSLEILIIDCQSSLFSELCDFVSHFFNQANVPHTIVRRAHNDLSDLVHSDYQGYQLLVISGSHEYLPDSPEVKDVTVLLRMAVEQNKPAFGACFGLQLLAYVLDPLEGKLIKEGSWDEDVRIEILAEDPIFNDIGEPGDIFTTRQYHYYSVPYSGKGSLGKGKILARSKDGVEILRAGNVLTTQFHPESRFASKAAKRVFQNYLKEFLPVNRFK